MHGQTAYIILVEDLISLFQSHTLTIAKLHGIEKSWTSKFNALYTKMTDLEHKSLELPKLSLSCKDLYKYFDNQNSVSVPKKKIIDRVNAGIKSSNRGKNTSAPSITIASAGSPDYRRTSSNYYSKMMNNFLQLRTPSKSIRKRTPLKLDKKDFWLLGDDINILNN